MLDARLSGFDGHQNAYTGSTGLVDVHISHVIPLINPISLFRWPQFVAAKVSNHV